MKTFAKAIASAITAALTGLGVVLVAGSSFGDLDAKTWVTLAAGVFAAFTAVFYTTNKPA